MNPQHLRWTTLVSAFKSGFMVKLDHMDVISATNDKIEVKNGETVIVFLREELSNTPFGKPLFSAFEARYFSPRTGKEITRRNPCEVRYVPGQTLRRD